MKKEGGMTIKHRNKNYGGKTREEGKGTRRMKERRGMKTIKRLFSPRDETYTRAEMSQKHKNTCKHIILRSDLCVGVCIRNFMVKFYAIFFL
jgi:hypothetical protein